MRGVRVYLMQHDMVALVHTGATPGLEAIALDRDVHCVCSMPRPVGHAHGGVACYVKPWLRHACTVARKHEELGILWVRVDGVCSRPLFVAICYLPPQASSYYKAAGAADLLDHFAVLQSDAAAFGASGDVMLVGDFNARTGARTEVDGVWDGLQGAGVVLPPAHGMRMGVLPDRASMDSSNPVTAQGKLLLDLCRTGGLAILNGRTPGDAAGAFTFVKPRKQPGVVPAEPAVLARSVIDYVIVSPALVFDEQGACKPGCDMHVGPGTLLPQAPGGHKFDHLPVSATVDIGRRPEPAPMPEGRRAQRYIWCESAQDAYTELLESDACILGAFDKAMAPGATSTAAIADFGSALQSAVHQLEGQGFRVQAGVQAPANPGAPRNSWYNGECRQARKGWRIAARVHGDSAAQTKTAFQRYRAAIRHAKAAALQAKGMDMARKWYASPRTFWASYTGRGAGSGLNDVEAWSAYFKALLNPSGGGVMDEAREAALKECFPQATAVRVEAAGVLNAEVTECEVVAALDGMALNKAPGVDGLPAEYLKCAVRLVRAGDRVVGKKYVLAPVLTRLFNLVMHGEFPPDWSTAALTPVPKPKGDPTAFDNHRGIAVGPALGKLFSAVMVMRMDAWAEGQMLRAAGQAGFRKGRSTIDNMFVLQHVIERSRIAHKPVYCAFIDFRKAYDCVDRDVLWRCLQSLGVHGCMLDTLKGMYRQVQMQVRVDGKVGEPFEATCGVRQGDPLSPLLFGLLIDRFEQFLRQRLPNAGVQLGMQVLQLLLYADDVVLMTHSPSELQLMLDVLRDFCYVTGMAVNVPKSEVVVFNSQWSAVNAQYTWQYNGVALKRVDGFCYLGLLFQDQVSIKACMELALTRGRAAMHALIRRCASIGFNNVAVKCYLFNTLVEPIMSYGCELWAPYWLCTMAKSDMQWGSGYHAERLHAFFLRHCTGLPASAPLAPLMHDLGRTPVTHAWLNRIMCFWNRVMKRPASDLVRMALEESRDWGGQGTTWAGTVQKCMGILDVPVAADGHTLPVRLAIDNIKRKWAQVMWQPLTSLQRALALRGLRGIDVRGCPDDIRDGFKLFVYSRWFADPAVVFDRQQNWPYHVFDWRHVVAVARFRLGSSWLNVEQLRYQRVVRSARLCDCCPQKVREDEMHILECPRYAQLRSDFADVMHPNFVSSDSIMRQVMTHGNDGNAWRRLASFLHACYVKRERVLAHMAAIVAANGDNVGEQ